MTAAFSARALDVCAQKTVKSMKKHDFSTLDMIIKTKQMFQNEIINDLWGILS